MTTLTSSRLVNHSPGIEIFPTKESLPINRIIAHEMRHYLSTLKDGITYLRECTSVDHSECCVLESAVRNMQNLAESLRFGCSPPRCEAMDIRETIWEQIALLELRASLAGIQLEISIPDHCIYVRADSQHLGRAFLNLIINAIEACEAGSSVSISCWSSRSQVHLSIRDTGIGMTTEQLSMMWTPLFTTKSTGTGLGACIARQIIINHGGSINAESTLGIGTTIRIDLPKQSILTV